MATVPLDKLLASRVVSPLPSPYITPATLKFLAIPTPPSTTNAPLVVALDSVTLSILTTVFDAKFILTPSSAVIVSSAILPTLVILFSLKLAAPRLTVPVAVKLSAPISIAPKPLVILPLFNAPVPVMLSWCCVTAPTAILAFGTVPLSMLLPAILPVFYGPVE